MVPDDSDDRVVTVVVARAPCWIRTHRSLDRVAAAEKLLESACSQAVLDHQEPVVIGEATGQGLCPPLG